MSALRRRLLRPEPWLGALLAACLFLVADAMRPPQQQVSVRVFSVSVDGYHRWIHPLTSRFIRCRYSPTCSRYAVESVRRYGIARGGWMSVKRLARCRSSVPLGTADPVP